MSNEINPYQSPAEITFEERPRTASSLVHVPDIHDYRSAHTRAVAAMVMLAAVMVVLVMQIGITAMQINLIKHVQSGGTITVEEGQSNDSKQVAITGVRIVVWIISGIAFMVWMHRAYKNLRPLGNRGLAYSPGWAIGCWFIPIGNLFYPCYIATEIWHGSDPKPIFTNDGKQRKAPPLIQFWWGGHVIMSISFSILRSFSTNTLDSILLQNYCLIIGNLIALPTAVLAIMVVRRIDRNQEERYQTLLQMPAPSPTPSFSSDDPFAFLEKC